MKFWSLVILSLMPFVFQALETGERLAPWTSLDQCTTRPEPRRSGRDPAGSAWHGRRQGFDRALLERPEGYLQARRAVFVADIQRMPGNRAACFAVPAMRAYSYRVMLDRDGRVASRYPGAEDKVLWLQLRAGRLVE